MEGSRPGLRVTNECGQWKRRVRLRADAYDMMMLARFFAFLLFFPFLRLPVLCVRWFSVCSVAVVDYVLPLGGCAGSLPTLVPRCSLSLSLSVFVAWRVFFFFLFLLAYGHDFTGNLLQNQNTAQ